MEIVPAFVADPCQGQGGVRRAVILALLALLAVPARAERQVPLSVLPGVGPEDRRRPVDPEKAPWRGLGRVQLEIGGRCTGTLVGPRTVLTAAHCLVARRTGRPVQPGTVHFLLGYHQGGWTAHARVVAYRLGPGYDSASRRPPGADWALLTLERPIGGPDRILPLRREAPAAGKPLVLGGYQQDRPEVLLADTACRMLGLSRDPAGLVLLVHDCVGTRGASGAPLLARAEDGRWAVVGVASATALKVARGVAVPAGAIGPLPVP